MSETGNSERRNVICKGLYQNSVPCQHPCRALIWSACFSQNCGYSSLSEKKSLITEQKHRQERVSLLWMMRKNIMI